MSGNNMHVEDAMTNKLAKIAVQIFVWLMPFVFAGLGWVVSMQLGEIKHLQVEQGEKLRQVTSDVQVLNAKLDTGVIWRLTELERRLNQVEQAQKVP